MTAAKRVLVVVTGEMEEVALTDALGRLFPSAYFAVRKTHGFTSHRLPRPLLLASASPRQQFRAKKIAEILLGAAVTREPGGLPYDYAVAVEDVELQNETGEAEAAEREADEGIACILGHVKLGIDALLQEKNQEQEVPTVPKGKAKRALSIATDADRRHFLRERCSFHLLRPMAEALFFGDPAAVPRAAGPGVALPPVRFDPHACDIEKFETEDEPYLATADDTATPVRFHPWRRRHPKLYLQYLLESSGGFYKETDHGKRALSTLDWQHVVSPPSHARMVRALLDDIADMLGVTLPWCAAGPCHPLTQRKRGGCLRNVV